MATVKDVNTVALKDLDPKQREVVAQAALDELPLLQKRNAELEGQLRTRKGVGFRLTQVLGNVVLLAVVVLTIIAAVATSHRLLTWGFQ